MLVYVYAAAETTASFVILKTPPPKKTQKATPQEPFYCIQPNVLLAQQHIHSHQPVAPGKVTSHT